MKRRNAEFGKLRRPMKRNKIAEGMYGSNTFLYVKYLILWAIVITADFMLDFRFEFLWPFWLLLRSVYDSFKYKGLSFTILFVCIAITSDLVCLFFIPVSWLFFLASTYVWVQYVWHAADKGFCLPTILLWALFLYLEGAIRWRDDKSIPHVDLCRPFAAHCIGYPVVTLGFGVKSYVGYRIRHRKQREVAKENEFYMQLLQFALPNDELLHAQMKQAPEILHSDKLGDIDLPVSSAIIAQRIQQQQLLMMSNSHMPSTNNSSSNGTSSVVNANSTSSSSSSSTSSLNFNHNNNHNIRSNGHSNHKQVNGHTMNGFSSTVSAASSQSSSTGSSTGTTSTSTIPFSHNNSSNSNNSNNNNMNSSNLNLTATHNGFGLNHNNTINPTHSNHFNSTSVLTYRSNRRSMDRSDNKISTDPVSPSTSSSSASTRNALPCNDPIQEGLTPSRSYLNMCLHIIYKTLMFIYCGFSKRRSTALNNSNNKLPDSAFSRFMSMLKYRVVGGNCDVGNYMRNISNDNTNDQNTYIERIDDEHMETSDLSVNTTSGKVTTTFTSTAPVTIELPPTASSSGYSNVQQSGDMEKPVCKQNGNADSDTQVNVVENNCTTNISNTETTERGRGRRNRGKQKDQQQHITTQINKDNHSNSNAVRNPSPLSQQIDHCETCGRFEVELKKMRSEVSHLKQIEHELRQKCDQNSTTKSCLQAKQKENDELEKKLQELTSARQLDRQTMQQTDRKLIEERRQRQSLETQLNNERKQRKLAEEKLSRIDCSENCKMRKQMLENECKQLRRDMSSIEELKKTAEQQSRNYEQELRKFEAELRSRETRESTEVLMSALQAMQDKNTTLEKSLSAETRVKLDLFSALGEAKRQLEIRDNVIRQKDKEVVDLKSKIAQLYAVMPSVPNESYLPQCSSTSSTILRLSDSSPAPQLSHSESIYSSKNDVA